MSCGGKEKGKGYVAGGGGRGVVASGRQVDRRTQDQRVRRPQIRARGPVAAQQFPPLPPVRKTRVPHQVPACILPPTP